MITIGTDNLDSHTIFVSYSFYGGDVYRQICKSDNVLYEEPLFDDIKHSHQYTRNLHSFILSHVVTLSLVPFIILSV